MSRSRAVVAAVIFCHQYTCSSTSQEWLEPLQDRPYRNKLCQLLILVSASSIAIKVSGDRNQIFISNLLLSDSDNLQITSLMFLLRTHLRFKNDKSNFAESENQEIKYFCVQYYFYLWIVKFSKSKDSGAKIGLHTLSWLQINSTARVIFCINLAIGRLAHLRCFFYRISCGV